MAAAKRAIGVHFGKNLRACRLRAGITQEELCLRASVHRTEISLLEVGARVPRIDTLIKLASALSVQPGELLVGINWRLDTVQRGGFEFRSHGETDTA